jgi:hypothetical protein
MQFNRVPSVTTARLQNSLMRLPCLLYKSRWQHQTPSGMIFVLGFSSTGAVFKFISDAFAERNRFQLSRLQTGSRGMIARW